MWSHVWKWFTDKWPYYGLRHLLLDEDVPGGTSYFYTLGTVILVIFAVQVVSGIVQLFYYVPSVDYAYDSVSYLRTQVPFGWFIHNMHYWGAQAMVFIVTLHMIRVYIWKGYKNPLTWLIGVLQLLTVMALSFTGAPLVWDMKGYWDGEVGSSITSTVPVVGDIFTKLLRGGETMGQLALSRFFIFHVGILTPILAALIGSHIAAFRFTGVVGSWDERKNRFSAPLWPDQLYKDSVTSTIVFFILIVLCVFAPPSFSGAADPSNTTYLPKPEWNFLFIYQALKYFHGPWEPVGTVGVPFVLIALLIVLPFIDRSPERNAVRRPIAMACLVVYGGFVVVFTILGWLSPGFTQMPILPGAEKKAVVKPQAFPGAKKGEQLFNSEGCTACHRVNGAGGTLGPDLSQEGLKGRDRQWLRDQIRNPKSHFPTSIMPSFVKLTDDEVNDLIDYLLSLGAGSSGSPSSDVTGQERAQAAGARSNDAAGPGPTPRVNPQKPAAGHAHVPAENLPGPAAYVIGDAVNGAVLFKQQCSSCHGPDGKDHVPNPGSIDGTVPPLNPIDPELFNAAPQIFAENIDKIIQHGSVPPGPSPAITMPAWGDTHSLTQQEIANIEAYIMSLNKVNRARLMHPGMEPKDFLILVVAVYAAVIVVLLSARRRAS